MSRSFSVLGIGVGIALLLIASPRSAEASNLETQAPTAVCRLPLGACKALETRPNQAPIKALSKENLKVDVESAGANRARWNLFGSPSVNLPVLPQPREWTRPFP